jgi:hypothetical protein
MQYYVLLLSHFIAFHAVCTVVFPVEYILVVSKSLFPYLQYSHLGTIINIPSHYT